MGQCPDRRFRYLVASGSDALLRAARLLCGDWSQAEDLLQRSLARSLATWDPDQPDRAAWVVLRQDLLATYLDDLPEFEAGRRRTRGLTGSYVDGMDELDPVVRCAVVARHYLELSASQTGQVIGVEPARAADVAARCLDWLAERQRLAAAHAM